MKLRTISLVRSIVESEYVDTLISGNAAHSYDDPALQQKQQQFQQIYRALPGYAQELIIVYKLICKSYGMDPGEVTVWMVGGRTKGKPLKADSDIDLIFACQNPRQALHTEQGFSDEQQDEKLMRGHSLNRRAWELAARHGIDRGIVHILGSTKAGEYDGIPLAKG